MMVSFAEDDSDREWANNTPERQLPIRSMAMTSLNGWMYALEMRWNSVEGYTGEVHRGNPVEALLSLTAFSH